MMVWTTLVMRPDAFRHTDVAEMKVPPVSRAKYFVTFINRMCENISASHRKVKSGAMN